ncbi:hypothetical protein GGS26DRAFT_549556 [Hypomontagnella submonticulosa]|nr:hypothetical protein GGS26DRAFT_549556 [Hypomontagnella submonticulosa]
MAEIPDSDSPDPLSSTPAGTSTPTPSPSSSIASTFVSTISDLNSPDSLASESSSNHLERPRHLHSHHDHSSPGSISVSSGTSSSISSWPSSSAGDYFDHLYPHSPQEDDYYDGADSYDDLFDTLDSEDSEEESLFVNDRYNSSNPDSNSDDVPIIPRFPVWFAEEFDFDLEEDDRMDRLRDRDSQGDELVEMEMAGPGNHRDHRRNRQPQFRAQPEVIDLTGDSPVQLSFRNQPQNARRRQPQQRETPPRLARSDASYVGSRTVIDLISDSDEEPVMMQRSLTPPNLINVDNGNAPNVPHAPPAAGPFGLAINRRRAPNQLHQPGQDDAIRRRIQSVINQIPIFRGMLNYQIMGDINHDEEEVVMLGHRNVMAEAQAPPQPDLPPVNLNYGAHPFPNQPHAAGGHNQKPVHDPPKETREGFTRNTGEDVVAICASCEEELAYDPDEDDGPPPAKKARTKKDNAEHHFWAVKACGHVYCRRCYENRKSTGKRGITVGFRPVPDAKNKVLCAVEDCDTDVSAKNAWVGIFL